MCSGITATGPAIVFTGLLAGGGHRHVGWHLPLLSEFRRLHGSLLCLFVFYFENQPTRRLDTPAFDAKIVTPLRQVRERVQPSLLVVVVTVSLLSVFVAITVAPRRADPLWSFTIPEIVDGAADAAIAKPRSITCNSAA
jgi:hypothetical protein